MRVAFEIPIEGVRSRLAIGQFVPFLGDPQALKVWIDLKEATICFHAPFDQFRIEIKGDNFEAIAYKTKKNVGTGGPHNIVEIPINLLSEAIKAGADTLRVQQL